MAVPKFTPLSPTDQPRTYASPKHVPAPWRNDRPASIESSQPKGQKLGYQGPDQGFALKIAESMRESIVVQPGESADDAICGAIAIALRRASRYGRAPVVHDLTIAFGIWGWMLLDPPSDLVKRRKELFVGLGDAAHCYSELRALVDMVPESTMLMTPEQVRTGMPGSWRALTGA
ncbi:MAG: hypothetical protein FJW19_06450 [Actinobacteria bacterium]|nr:hypothetical protein [Actinomycetota bacterium]